MARRSRQRKRSPNRPTTPDAPRPASPDTPREKLKAPTSDYRDADGNVLTLRGSLTPGSRREYAEVLAGGRDREDAWQRAVELLFERLAVSWTIAGLRTERQKELLARYRIAAQQERRFVRDALREHLAENFPELQAP